MTPQGAVKLLDFGIAKLLDPVAVAETLATRTLHLTPRYAAPEQLKGEATTTATDVYALGVVLYELLTGTTPAGEAGTPLALALQRLLHDQTRPPSAVARERAEAPVPARLLVGDLDAIVLKALRPEPEARYPSAAELLADLDRHARHQPVAAREAALGYVLRRFARRHRVAVAAVGAVFAALVIALGTSLAFYEQARRSEQRALAESAASKQISDYLVALFDAAAPEQTGGRPIEPKLLIDQGLRQIEVQLREQPTLRLRMRGTLGSIYSRLGASREAIATLSQVLDELRASAGADTALIERMQLALAQAHYAQRDFAKADAVLTEALARASGDAPYSEPGGELASLAVSVKIALRKPEEAQRLLDRAWARIERSGRTDGVEAAELLLQRAELAFQVSATQDEGSRLEAQAIRILRQQLGESHPRTIKALMHSGLMMYHAARYPDSARDYREALVQSRKLYGEDNPYTATAMSNLAMSLQPMGGLAEASALMQAVLASQRRLVDPESILFAEYLNNLSQVLEDYGDYAGAVAALEEASAIAARHPEEDPSAAIVLRNNLSGVLNNKGEPARSLALLASPIDLQGDTWDMDRAIRLKQMGSALRQLGRFDEALAAYDAADVFLAKTTPPGHPQRAAIKRGRGLLALARQRPAEAVPLLRTAFQGLSPVFDANASIMLELRLELAEALRGAGQSAEADQLIRDAAPVVEQRLAPSHNARRRLERLRKKET